MRLLIAVAMLFALGGSGGTGTRSLPYMCIRCRHVTGSLRSRDMRSATNSQWITLAVIFPESQSIPTTSKRFNISHILQMDDDEKREAVRLDREWQKWIWLCRRIRAYTR